jgi:VanZ family protein
VAAWLALAALAAVDEATQPLVGREADRLDWYADLAGLAAGLAVIATGLLIWRRHRRGTQATV